MLPTGNSESKSFDFDLGLPPSHRTRPRLYGDSDTVHHNLKGQLEIGSDFEKFESFSFGTAEFTLDKYHFNSPYLDRDGVVIQPGQHIIWEPEFCKGPGSIMIVAREVEVSGNSRNRYFWYRYPPESPWNLQDFVGIVVSRDFSRFGWAVFRPNEYPPNADPEWTPSSFIEELLQGEPDEDLDPNGWYRASRQVASAPVSSKAYLRSYWKRTLRAVCHRLSESIVYDESEMAKLERSLGQTACDAFRPVEANAFSTLIELTKLRSEITDWVDGLREIGKNVRHPGKFIRALGNFRLSTKWGIPLTVKDAKEIADQVTDDLVYGVRRNNWQSSRARDSIKGYPKRGLWGLHDPVEIKVGLKAYVSKYDNRLARFASGLFDYGFISYSNVWDMIPYSFVVDWFTNVSERVELIDSTTYKDAFLDVKGSVLSHCWELNVPTSTWRQLTGLPVRSANVTYRFYQREILDSIPWPHLEDKELSSNLGFIQYLDGATLILQRVPE
jgi:hypothetical protein